MTLEIITSEVLAPLRHGFFTRHGGASSGIYKGLNCGQGSQDQSDVVAINRARVAEAMQVTPQALLGVHQVHSADVIEVTDTPLADKIIADGMVTATPGLALSILTADCQPVLFADASAGVVGAAHAGWKGALLGVLDATIQAMESLGAQRARIDAVIGPTIGPDSYEVGPEFHDRFAAEDPSFNRFFRAGKGDRMLFDLPAFGLYRLRKAGIHRAEWTGHCTYSDPDRFYSYRRAVHRREPDYGRLLSTIRL